MKVEISHSELFDKYTILEIKTENNLDVEKEKKILKPLIEKLFKQYKQSVKLYNILLCINREMWCVEDEKRDCEKHQKFDDEFVTLSRMVYLLNTQRAKIKRTIDTVTNSSLMEVKSKNF